jgi:large subunit ribosomal protein L24
VQTTLLGIAIALILALVAALVGPHFVDWGRYRTEFETQASRLTGLTVLVNGPVEARLLPTPALTFGRVEIARRGDSRALRARSVSLEFSLGALMRGEYRANEVRIEGADMAVGLDATGRLDWPAPALGNELESLAIDRLDIVDSRVFLADVASGSQVLLEKLDFRGELRSRLGPIKGEGAFEYAGHRYPFRIAANRAGDAGTRVRLNLDPVDRPLSADADALIMVERGVPRFEGTLTINRAVGRTPDGIVQPWRVSSRIRGDSIAATLEQIEFQYGPDERAIKLRGDANVAFGRDPQVVINLASTQIDLDRLLGLPEDTRKRPLLAIKTFADTFGGAQRPPMPVRIGLSIENVTLAGALLQRVSGEVVADADSWNLDVLDFRAPGATQVGLSGRLNITSKGVAFDGRAKVEARDPRALTAWLTADAQTISAGALRAEGDVKLASDHVAIDGLTAEIDRMTTEGRVAYSWAKGEQPARIEVSLNAPDIDFDRAYALAQGVFAGTPFEMPREGTVSLKAARAAVAGVEARRADIDVQFERGGIDIKRLVVGDFGGAALAVKGRIDNRAQTPRGSLTLDLDARSLEGVASALEKVAPQAATELRRRASRFVPAKLQASLTVGSDVPRQAAASALKLDGNAGPFKISLQGQTDSADVFTLETPSRLASSKLKLTGRLDASDGGALVELLGLDALVAVDKRAGRLELRANGPINGEMEFDGQLVAGSLDVSATKGSVRLADGPTAAATVKVTNANVRSLRPVASGRPAETIPLGLTAKLAYAGGAIDLTDIVGRAAGSEVTGRLKIGLQPLSANGEIELGEINLPVVIAAATGNPPQGGTAVWAAEPFERGLLGQIGGRVVVRSAHVALAPRLAAKNVRALVQLDQTGFAIKEIDGALAGGRVAGEFSLWRGADGVSTRSRLQVSSADIAELVRGGPPPLSGRLTGDVEVEGTGRSPVALIGSLKGGGTFSLQDGGMQRLDPSAFETVIRNVDQGLQLDATRIRDRMEQALAAGVLPVARAEGEFTVTAGQARTTNVKVNAQGVDIGVSGSALLAEDSIDARLTLTGPTRPDAPSGARPEVTIALKGATDAPKRTLDATAFSNWLALRSVEQQSKRIDALEAGRDSREAPREQTPPKDPAVVTTPSAAPPSAAPTPPSAQATRPRQANQPPANQPPAAAPTTGSTRPRQPLDLQPPASGGKSLLDNLLGR